jgi:7,8-dihydroneopterin aldolase/epimerase/oxygenase
MNIVEVIGIEVYAYHGCMDEEAKLGGKYLVDISIQLDFSISASTDKLADTVDYVLIRKIVVEEMAVRSKLIEHVGYRIQQRFKADFQGIIKSRIKVRKLNPPIEGTVQEVAIIIEG